MSIGRLLKPRVHGEDNEVSVAKQEYTKAYKIYKIYKLYKLEIMPYKSAYNADHFEFFNMDFRNVRTCWNFGNMFLYSWCVLYYSFLFLMPLWDSVSVIVCMNRFERDVSTFFENCPRSVNNFRTIVFVRCLVTCWDDWVLNGPPPPPSLASMSKFPSRGKNLEKHKVLMLFYDCHEKRMKKWYWNDYVV